MDSALLPNQPGKYDKYVKLFLAALNIFVAVTVILALVHGAKPEKSIGFIPLGIIMGLLSFSSSVSFWWMYRGVYDGLEEKYFNKSKLITYIQLIALFAMAVSTLIVITAEDSNKPAPGPPTMAPTATPVGFTVSGVMNFAAAPRAPFTLTMNVPPNEAVSINAAPSTQFAFARTLLPAGASFELTSSSAPDVARCTFNGAPVIFPYRGSIDARGGNLVLTFSC